MNFLVVLLSVLLYGLGLCMLIHLWFRIKKFHKVSIKDTMIYPIIVVATLILLFVANAYYLKLRGINLVVRSFEYSFTVVTLKLDANVLKTLLHTSICSKFLFGAYLTEFGVSLLASICYVIILLLISFKSLLRRIILFFNTSVKEINYVFGFNEDAKKYMKNYSEEYIDNKEKAHKIICVLNSSVSKNYDEEKLFLHKCKISYIMLPYSKDDDILKVFNKVSKGKKRENITTFFDDDELNYVFVKNALKHIELYNKGTKFIFVTNIVQEKYLNNLLYSENNVIDKSAGRIRIVNKYDLISLEFIRDHNFAKYFPKDKNLINDDLTINDCDINLYVFGLGKVNQAVLRDSLIINQFVKKIKENDKYKLYPKRINVEVFDSKEKIESSELFNGILKYNRRKYDGIENNYLQLPEDYISNVKFNSDTSVFEEEFLNKLFKNISDKSNTPQINYFLISLDTDFVNYSFAKKLKTNIDYINNTYNTYFVRIKEDKFDISKNIIPYGNYKDVYSYSNIVSNHLNDMADIYHLMSFGKRPSSKRSTVEIKSSLYSVCSLYFKLSLMIINSDKKDLKTLHNVFVNYPYPIPNKEYKMCESNDNLEFYDSLTEGDKATNIRDVLSFMEHERWNAFELSIGALPFKKEYCENYLKYICEKIYKKEFDKLNEKEYRKIEGKDENEIIYDLKFNKTLDDSYHLCLTTSYGLKQYYIYISSLIKKYKELYNINITSNYDVVHYDYKYIDKIKEYLESTDEKSKNENEIKKLFDEIIFVLNKK